MVSCFLPDQSPLSSVWKTVVWVIVSCLFIPNLLSCLLLLWVRESMHLIFVYNCHISAKSALWTMFRSQIFKGLGIYVHSQAKIVNTWFKLIIVCCCSEIWKCVLIWLASSVSSCTCKDFFLVNELKISHKKLRWVEVLYFSCLTKGSFHVCGSQNFTRSSMLLVILALLIPQTRI